MSNNSQDPNEEDARPNDVRPLIDETDRRILKILAVEARIPNNALAQRVGIAPSTCLGRVRSLVENGQRVETQVQKLLQTGAGVIIFADLKQTRLEAA